MSFRRSPLRLALLAGCLLVGLHATADEVDRVRSFLADLPADLLEQQPSSESEALRAVYEASTPYEFDAGAVVAFTDPRWFSSLPSDRPGAPLLELRRWPGDTVLALYAIAEGPAAGEGPPIPGAKMQLHSGEAGSDVEWRGMLRTESGPRYAVWIERRVEGSTTRLAALLLPGDAGLGEPAVSDLTLELRATLERVRIRPEVWRNRRALPAGTPVDLPLTGPTPAAKTEESAPWQVARATSFTIGLPPGFRARRLDGSIPPPVMIPGGRLWMRGRFVDSEGTEVAVGDATRFGYVAEVPSDTPGWRKGERPPVGAPHASREASEAFPLLTERARARSGRAERWTEADFDGDWLVFRLDFEFGGIEIGLPVLRGRRSPALFWIPATWRGPDRAPAPPPVDPAERYGIRFSRFTRGESAKRPWAEGILEVPGLRAELPRGWWPAASLRSEAGFPIRLLDRAGETLGVLSRLEGEGLDERVAAEGWTETARPGAHRAERVLEREDAVLFVSKQGHAFLFRAEVESGRVPEGWGRMAQSVLLVRE